MKKKKRNEENLLRAFPFRIPVSISKTDQIRLPWWWKWGRESHESIAVSNAKRGPKTTPRRRDEQRRGLAHSDRWTVGPLKNSFESNVAKLGGTMCAKDTVVVSQNVGILLVLLRGGSQTFSNRLVESFKTRSVQACKRIIR